MPRAFLVKGKTALHCLSGNHPADAVSAPQDFRRSKDYWVDALPEMHVRRTEDADQSETPVAVRAIVADSGGGHVADSPSEQPEVVVGWPAVRRAGDHVQSSEGGRQIKISLPAATSLDFSFHIPMCETGVSPAVSSRLFDRRHQLRQMFQHQQQQQAPIAPPAYRRHLVPDFGHAPEHDSRVFRHLLPTELTGGFRYAINPTGLRRQADQIRQLEDGARISSPQLSPVAGACMTAPGSVPSCFPCLPLGINPTSPRSSTAAAVSDGEHAVTTPTKFNPFANCPPLTSDIDTNRLYPRINPPKSSSDSDRLPKPSQLANQNGGASVQSRDAMLYQRFDLLAAELLKSADWLRYLRQVASVEPRQFAVALAESPNEVSHRRPRGQVYADKAAVDRSPIAPTSAGAKLVTHDDDAGVGAVTSSTPRGPSGLATAVGRYRCSECPKTYSTIGGLTKHREFYCRRQPINAKAHAAARSGPTVARVGKPATSSTASSRTAPAVRDQRCPQCDKAYTSASALKMHIRTHTLPCRCRLCGKAFSRPWLLQGHLRTHTGEKPFECPHCSRAFADRSNLRAHLQTHYDVKQYSCAVCRRTFSRMSLLTKHRYGGGPCSGNVGVAPPPPTTMPTQTAGFGAGSATTATRPF